MFKIRISQTGTDNSKTTAPFRVRNVLVMQGRIFEHLEASGAEVVPHFVGTDPDYGSVCWVVGEGPSMLRVWLSEQTDSWRDGSDDLPVLDPIHVGLVIDELVYLAVRERGSVDGLPVPVLDRRGLYGIVDDFWPSVDGKFAGEPPQTTIRRFSTNRHDLQAELWDDDEYRRLDADTCGEVDPEDRDDSVEGSRIEEFYGPLLPEPAAAPALRRAA